MKTLSHSTHFNLVKRTLLKIGILLIATLGLYSRAFTQYIDQLTSPTVNVRINYPPLLGIKINKVIFDPTPGNCADQIIDALISMFVNQGVEVMDRANLDAILAEQNFTYSGYIDQTTAITMGKIIGPSTMIKIKVPECRTEIKDNLYEMEKKYDPETNQYYQVKANIARTRVFLKVSLQTIDLTTGKIFSAHVFEYTPSMQNKSYTGNPEAPSEFDVKESAIASFKTEVFKLFFHWTEKSTLHFFDDKDCGLKQAYQVLEVGNIEEAHNLSLQNLESCKNSPHVNDKNLAHAYYNLGMTYMILGEYDEAIKNLTEAQKLRPGDIAKEAILECSKAKLLAEAMQKFDEKASFELEKAQAAQEQAVKVQESSTLTNTDIITMTQKKIPTSIIIQKIKTSNCNFDMSTDELENLINAGVSEDVIIIMMEK